jgi:hypothetical protein
VVSKINWQEAYQWFIADARRSYADVAKNFNVSKQSVERNARTTTEHGKSVTWAKRRQSLGENAQKRTDDEYRKSTPARTEQHLMQYRNLQIILSAKITLLAQGNMIQSTDAGQLASIAKALKIAIDGERVILGLTTSVSAIKPENDDSGKGWGELLALAMRNSDERFPTNQNI